VTYSGFNLKYSIEDILTSDEKLKLESGGKKSAKKGMD
jgi:hypothetical protein